MAKTKLWWMLMALSQTAKNTEDKEFISHLFENIMTDPEIVPPDYVDVVFDKPPGPGHSYFVDVHDSNGKSVRVGEWVDLDNGMVALRMSLQQQKTVVPEGYTLVSKEDLQFVRDRLVQSATPYDEAADRLNGILKGIDND